MHGMLSAAILVLVFALVTAAVGGSMVWLYRVTSVSSGYSRSPCKASADPVPDTVVDAPASRPALEHSEGHLLALPAAAEPAELEAPSAEGEAPADGSPSEGAEIYVLDSSRRPSR
jgi:hypothetical protein